MTTTTNNRKSFILHSDSLEVLDKLSDEQAGKIFKAIKIYQKTGEIVALDFALEIAFLPFLNQFKRDLENYQKTCEARRLAGSIGGKQKVANASKSKQKVASLADSDSKNDSKNKNKNDNKNELLVENQFESFWQSYIPVKTKDGFVKKGSREKAEIAFVKALKKASFEKIMAALESYLIYCQQNNRFTKNAVSWLNEGDFEITDETCIVTKKLSRGEETLKTIFEDF